MPRGGGDEVEEVPCWYVFEYEEVVRGRREGVYVGDYRGVGYMLSGPIENEICCERHAASVDDWFQVRVNFI